MEPERVITAIEDIIGIGALNALRARAKIGEGVRDILEAGLERKPLPQGNLDAPLGAIIIHA